MTRQQFEFNYKTAKCELNRAEILVLQCGLRALKVVDDFLELWKKLEDTDKELIEALEKISQNIG